MYVIGVDGCRRGWVAVALTNGRFAGASHFTSFADLHAALDDAYAMAVDIPLGLVAEGSRTCDELVRASLGPRGASVFAVPPRRALQAQTYEEANELTRALMGQGLTKQAYALRGKILEADGVLAQAVESPPRQSESARELMMRREDPVALRKYARIIEPDDVRREQLDRARPGGRVIEAHPEASFAEMAGHPLRHTKKSYNGVMARIRLLERAQIVIPLELDEVGGVSIDDVLDAAAVAWTAHRYAMRRAMSRPGPDAWQRDGDRVISIWT
ncbi:MAG: DUF429 domain-containing protein [Myxococcota bacterium]